MRLQLAKLTAWSVDGASTRVRPLPYSVTMTAYHPIVLKKGGVAVIVTA